MVMDVQLFEFDLEVHELLNEARIGVDDRPTLPTDIQSLVQIETVLHHEVSADTRRAPGNAGPAVHKHFASLLLDGLFNELNCLLEMATEILPRYIVHLEDFVLELALKSGFDTTEGLQNVRDSVLLQ